MLQLAFSIVPKGGMDEKLVTLLLVRFDIRNMI